MKKLWISNFEMWSWDVIFVPFSEKVTCTNTEFAKFRHAKTWALSPTQSVLVLPFCHLATKLFLLFSVLKCADHERNNQ